MKFIAKHGETIVTLIGCIVLAFAGIALYCEGYNTGRETTKARYEKIIATKEAAQAQVYARIESAYRAHEQRGDALAARAARAEQQNQKLLKEKSHAIRQATAGRACLNPDTVRLLNANLDTRYPGLSAPPGNPAVANGAAATDTDVALWAADVRTRYDACRGRIDALRQFYGDGND